MSERHRLFEREEDALEQRYHDGLLSREEYNREHRELSREYRALAQEAAQEAAGRELERW